MELELFKKEVAKGELLFKDKNKRKEALKHFDRMAAACPQNKFFKIRQIKINIDMHNWEKAESICLHMLETDLTNFFTYYFYSLTLIKNKKKTEAIRIINIGLAKYPEKTALVTHKILLEEMGEYISTLKLLRH